MAFDPKQNFTGNPFGAADMKRAGSGKKVGKILLIAVVVLFAATIALGAFTTVDEGHVGVRYQFGRIVEDDIPPGLVFKIPYVQQIVKVDVREQTYELITNAYTKDTQTVENLIIKLNYSYDESALSDIIRNVGIQNVESKLIIPQLQSVVKNEIGQYRAEELIQNRAKVQSTIEEKMSESLSQGGILVNNLAIEDIDFEDGFEEAVRAKVVAEQEALKMQNKTKEKEEMGPPNGHRGGGGSGEPENPGRRSGLRNSYRSAGASEQSRIHRTGKGEKMGRQTAPGDGGQHQPLYQLRSDHRPGVRTYCWLL